jgi:hypothetical protein
LGGRNNCNQPFGGPALGERVDLVVFEFSESVLGRRDRVTADRRSIESLKLPSSLSLTKPAQIDRWMSAPIADALALQLPLEDDALKIVARGQKADPRVARR